MNKTSAYLTLIAVSVLALSALMSTVKAGAISVGTFDTNTGALRDTFNIGESVRIIAQSGQRPLTVVIRDPDGAVVHTEVYNGLSDYDKVYDDITQRSGWYTVEATSPASTNRVNFATVFFNAIPEAPFGTVSIAIVSLGALGIYSVIKRRETTSI